MSFFAELRRRNVIRVGIAYIVIGWVTAQVAEFAFENFGAPPWVLKSFVVVLMLGLPLALFFAWAFELTPEGVKREEDVDRSKSITKKTGRTLNYVIMGALVIALGYFVWERQGLVEQARESADNGASANAAQQVSVAVLPFDDMSPAGDQEYFSDGISEEILNALVKIEGLRVISRTSAFSFKDSDLSIPEIAAELDVTHVLEGSVRTAGDQVRITAQLIEVATDSHLWSDAYSRQLTDIFEVQEEISANIADQLQLRLTADSTVQRVTDSPEAYQLFLRGRHFYQDRGFESLERAVNLLRRAVEIDDSFDEAWANLGAAAMVFSYWLDEDFEDLRSESKAAALRAVEIDPANGLAHAVLGAHAYSEGDFEGAKRDYDLAVELSPNESNNYLWRAILLTGLGYHQQALEDLHTAESFDPVFRNLHFWLIMVYETVGDYDRARHHRNVTLELEPSASPVVFGIDELIAAGDYDAAEARAMAHSGFGRQPDDSIAAFFSALRDPATIDDAESIIVANAQESRGINGFDLLFRLGRVEKSIELWKRMRDNGRDLRAMNQLGFYWHVVDHRHLADPAMVAFFEEIGIADYWRANGDPDFCRRLGDTFECGILP